MFVQVISGRTGKPDEVHAAMDRWVTELGPGAAGWLGSTGGVTDDGRLIALARFESADAARRNSERPEQDRWWRETAALLDRDAGFADSEDVMLDLAAVLLDDMARPGQPDAAPADGAGGVRCPVVRLEHAVYLGRRDADPVIADRKHPPVVLASALLPHTDRDLATSRAVLHRIGDQVRDDPLDARLVPVPEDPLTARAVASELGILKEGRLAVGAELEVMDDEELREVVGDIEVYARVSPYQMLISVPVIGAVGERVISYFGEFGKLDGWVSGHRDR